jgi:hypothetical protein
VLRGAAAMNEYIIKITDCEVTMPVRRVKFDMTSGLILLHDMTSGVLVSQRYILKSALVMSNFTPVRMHFRNSNAPNKS